MIFTKDSTLVHLWVKNIRTEKNPHGAYTREQVPNLSNLREVVFSALDEEE